MGVGRAKLGDSVGLTGALKQLFAAIAPPGFSQRNRNQRPVLASRTRVALFKIEVLIFLFAVLGVFILGASIFKVHSWPS